MIKHTPRPVHRHEIHGAATVVIPFDANGEPDWESFSAHLDRIAKVGLTPAISAIPGSIALLETSLQVGAAYQAHRCVGGGYFAGIHVVDKPGDWFNIDHYLRQIEVIGKHGATPIIFPSNGMNALSDADWLKAMDQIGRNCDRFMFAEVDPKRAPTGRQRSFDSYVGLLRNRTCVGVTHASMSRVDEWARLHRQPSLRNDFLIYSANERAVDMAIYGSNYMLVAAGMVPELYAQRDRLWAEGDQAFYELNDLLQYLAMFTSRAPIEALPHSALQFMRIRGWIPYDFLPPGIPERPHADLAVLEEVAERLGVISNRPTVAARLAQ